ncbi:MAG: hypothetical protein RLZZ306_3431 [Bacteroidota bacterium]|jgi:hypothetical protein
MKYQRVFSFDKFALTAILLVISTFYLACYNFSYNFFYQDDFHLLRFVTVFEDNSLPLQQKIDALYNQHNEHRIIFPRLFVLLGYYIQGYLDWRILNVISALYYLGIFLIFGLIIKKINLSYWYILPVALFIFQPSSFENFYWTISILQQVGNLFWAMLLFYSLVYFKPTHFWVSMILIIVLTFTHGNGLFGFGVGGILLFFQRRYKQLFIWIGLMSAVAGFYFYGYFTAQNSNISGSLSNPIRLISCFGGFFGGFIYEFIKNKYQVLITILGGLFIFVVLAMINSNFLINQFRKKFNNKFQRFFPELNLFLFACFLYLSITAGLVAISRSWSSIEAGFQNRYLHNSVISLVLLYVTFLHYQSLKFRRDVGVVFLICGFFFNIFSWYSNYELLAFQRKLQESDAVNYRLNKISIVNDKSFNENIEKVLNTSFEQGISAFPQSKLFEAVNDKKLLNSIKSIDYKINIEKDSLLAFNISNSNFRDIYEFNNFDLTYKGDTYLTLKSTKNIFISPTNHRRNSKLNFLKTGQFFTDGFYTSIMTDAMPKNVYEVGILQKVNNQFVFTPTKYKISTL